MIVVSAAAVLGTAAAPAAAQPVRPTPVEASVLHAINATRARHSVPRLRLEGTLQRAARAHAFDMVRRRYFAHGSFRERLARFGARGPIVGENLGWSTIDGAQLRRLIGLWLASPRHRAIMLRRGFDQVGVGVAHGPFMGWRHTIVVTVDFQGR